MRTNTAIERSVATKQRTGQQVAALPFRMTEAGLEVMLITSRRTRRWIVPKGWPEAGTSPAADAAREALEEAGVTGEVAPKPIGAFHYLKERKHGDGTNCRVNLFPLRVTRQRRTWPEKETREAQWFPYAEAAKLVSEPELKRLILRFGAQQAPRAA